MMQDRDETSHRADAMMAHYNNGRHAQALRGCLAGGGRDPRKDVFTQTRELLNRHEVQPDFERSILRALRFLFA